MMTSHRQGTHAPGLPKKPTLGFAKKTVARVRREYCHQHAALDLLKTTFPKNQRLEEVIIKCAAIDSLYKTHLRDNKEGLDDIIVRVANIILNLPLDSEFASENPDPGLVDKMASVRFGAAKRLRRYSFASKYCCMHRPDAYSRCDKHVCDVLKEYKRKYGCDDKFPEFFAYEVDSSNPKFGYKRFKKIVEEVRTYFGWHKLTFDDLDQFFWDLGKKLMKGQ